MRVNLGIARGSKTKDPKLAIMRRADTDANTKYGIGGVAKRRGGQKPVTLAKVNLPDPDAGASSWFCEPCKVEVYDRRCRHCGKLERDQT
jgi:hypothetical protein